MPKYSAQNVTKLLLEQLAATNVLVKNVLNNTKQEVTMTKPDGNHVGCALQAVSDPLAGSLGAILRENGKRGEERREDEKSEEVLLGGKAECSEASEGGLRGGQRRLSQLSPGTFREIRGSELT